MRQPNPFLRIWCSSFDFQRQIHGALACQLSRIRQCRIDIRARQRRIALQYLFVRYTCRNVVNYDGYQDTRSADTRSAVADSRVYADSPAPILHRFIFTTFSLQRHHRRHSFLFTAYHRQTLIGHWCTFKQIRNCYSSIDQRALDGQRRYDISDELSSTSKRESS